MLLCQSFVVNLKTRDSSLEISCIVEVITSSKPHQIVCRYLKSTRIILRNLMTIDKYLGITRRRVIRHPNVVPLFCRNLTIGDCTYLIVFGSKIYYYSLKHHADHIAVKISKTIGIIAKLKPCLHGTNQGRRWTQNLGWHFPSLPDAEQWSC